MESKKIQCPACKSLLEVKNSKNEAEKIITCPICKSQLRVRFQHQTSSQPLDAHTVLGPAQYSGETQLGSSIDGETRLAGDGGGSSATGSSSSPQKLLTPVLVYNGCEYSLLRGENIVGRKATNSTANVQIATGDRSMSRAHAIIDVRAVGQKVKAVLHNDKNKNPTYINGQELTKNDAIVLTSGCTIRMGQTIVTYKEK